MKRIVCVLLFAALMLQSLAQTPDASIDKRIYLLDVTKSMIGIVVKDEIEIHNEDNNVWEKVAAFLRTDIENITDPSTRLIVIPFNDKVCCDDCWEEQATVEGKSKLMRKINGVKDRWLSEGAEATKTNIVAPFSYAKNKYIDPRCNNLLILLTDGQDNVNGQLAWLQLLSSWQVYARDNNAYLIYFMVSDAANDKKIANLIENKECSDLVFPTGKIPDFIDLYPSKAVNFNIKDDIEDGVYIQFDNSKKSLKLANGVKVSVKSLPGAKVSVDCSAEIEDGKINIRLPYTTQELRTLLCDEDTVHVPLTIELLNQDEIQSGYNQKIFLKRNTVDLVLINKIEKVLTIKLKR